MSQAIYGVPSVDRKTTPATSSGTVSGTAQTDPNSFQLLVNWSLNQNISGEHIPMSAVKNSTRYASGEEASEA